MSVNDPRSAGTRTFSRYLVTGALGCIGAWTVRELLGDGATVIAFDLGDADYQLRLAVPPEMRSGIIRVTGDVTDRALLEQTIVEHGVDAVIHLAGLQVPGCRSDPILGARVNVIGTLAVFEAVKRLLPEGSPVVYASSVAAYGGDEDSAPGSPSGHAQTHYGVYKRANEGSAYVYWADHGVPSIGLRPYVVYGPGRDQGLTSEPTRAMLSAAAGKPSHIGYGGQSHMQYVADVARTFVNASRSTYRGAAVVNLAGSVVTMREVVAAIEAAAPELAGCFTFDDTQLPFPPQVSVEADGILELPTDTPLTDGVRLTIERFRDYLAENSTTA